MNKKKNTPFVSPSNKLFNECRERCSRIIFVQFWHTRENVQYCHLYIYVQQCLITVNFSILLWTMIDFVWKCIWLFLRLTIKMLSKLFSRDTKHFTMIVQSCDKTLPFAKSLLDPFLFSPIGEGKYKEVLYTYI